MRDLGRGSGCGAPLLGRARARIRDDAGVTALGVAILFPAILAMVFLVVQAGIYYHAQQWAAAAADRAVAGAAEFDAGDPVSAGQAAGASFLGDSAVCVDPSVAPVASGDGHVGFMVSCDVPGPLSGLVPGVSARSEGAIEEFVPETERG